MRIFLIIIFCPILQYGLSQSENELDRKFLRDSVDGNVLSIYDRAVEYRYRQFGGPLSNTFLKRVLRYYTSIDLANDTVLGRCHLLLGIDLADRKLAVDHCLQAVKYYARAYTCTHVRMHSAYFHAAEKLYINDELDRAYTYCDSALMCQMITDKNYNWHRTVTLLGRINGKLGKTRKSELLYAAALPYAMNGGDSMDIKKCAVSSYRDVEHPHDMLRLLKQYDRSSPFNYYSNCAQAHIMLHNTDSALHYLDLLQQLPYNFSASVENDIWRNRAIAYSIAERFDHAMDALTKVEFGAMTGEDSIAHLAMQSSLLAKLGKEEESKAHDNKIIDWYLNSKASNPFDRIYYLGEILERWWKLYRQTGGARKLQETLLFSEKINELLNKLRESNLAPKDRERLNSRAHTFYDIAIKIARESYFHPEVAQSAKSLLTLIEANRASVLEAEINARASNQLSITLESKLNFFESKLLSSDRLQSRQWSDSIFHTIYDDASQAIYRRQMTSNDFFKLLEPWTSDGSIYFSFVHHIDTSLTMVVSEAGSHSVQEFAKKDWYPLVRQFMREVASKGESSEDNIRNSPFADSIFAALASSTGPAIFIPDGILTQFPFEVLEDASGRMLIADHAVSYALSMGTLAQQMAYQYDGPELHAYAPAFEPGTWSSHDHVHLYTRAGMGPLLFNETEVDAVTSIIKNSRRYIGPHASRKEFLRNATQSGSVLHLATHAISNSKIENVGPYILFSAADDEPELPLSDLYTLKIPAHLIVMSACETGQGQYVAGEGVMSLARGFTYAGAKSVIASLWTANDRSTATLMENFYRSLADGQNKDEAMRHAKLGYLANCSPRAVHPYFWAGFVPIGDMSSLEFDRTSFWMWPILVLILTLVIVHLARRLTRAK